MKRENAQEWFKIRYVGNDVWAIDDNGSDVMYLVVGAGSSLLIDTGWGIGDLPRLVASLSQRPLIVVNTHGHPDHTYGNGKFEKVHICEKDLSFVQEPPAAELRRDILEHILTKPLPPDFVFDSWATSVPKHLVPIEDGFVFDLGRRILRTIIVPGHTPGSICLLDEQARLLFTGDSILSGGIWLHLEESLPLSQFYKNLRRLQRLSAKFDYIMPAHVSLQALPMSRDVLNDLVDGVEMILEGKLIGKEEKTFAGTGLRCDFGSCGIVYRPDRL